MLQRMRDVDKKVEEKLDDLSVEIVIEENQKVGKAKIFPKSTLGYSVLSVISSVDWAKGNFLFL